MWTHRQTEGQWPDAVTIDSMGPNCTAVRNGARENGLRKSDPAIDAVAARL
jgi:hypothetical protein